MSSRPSHLRLLVASAALLTSGCAALNRGPVPQHVEQARQMTLRGMQAAETEDWEDAETWFATAIAHNPDDKDARLQYAELLWRRGEADEAIKHVMRAIEVSGGDPRIRVRLGEMYLARGDSNRAFVHAKSAIDGSPQLASAWALRADIHRSRGEVEAAIVDYHRALTCQPSFARVETALADLYLEQGRPQRSLTTLRAMKAAYGTEGPPQDLLFREGLALKELHRYEEAATCLTQATDRGEASADLLFHLADAQWRAGRLANARLAVLAALSREPQHVASLALRDRLDDQQPAMTAALAP